MMTELKGLLTGALRGGLAIGLVVVGLLLSYDFFNAIDSLSMTFRPWIIVRSYGIAWVVYFVVATVFGIFMSGALIGLLMLLRRYDGTPTLAANLVLAVILSRVLALFPLHLFFPDYTARPLWAVTGYRLITIGLFIWLSWRHQSILNRARGFLKGVALCGCVAVGVTLIGMAAAESRTARVHRGSDGDPTRTNGPPPPIVLITIDTLAANRMSLYGYFRETTPSLDKVSKEFHVFDQHYSNSNFTTPSMASLLTGTRPWRHRTFHLTAHSSESVAQAGLVPTLRRAGYRTLAVATNPWASPHIQGINEWFTQNRLGHNEMPGQRIVNTFSEFAPVRYFYTVDRLLEKYERFAFKYNTSNRHYDPERTFAAAREILPAQRDQEPTFLWVHLMGPHDPYATPYPFLKFFDPSDKALTVRNSTPPVQFQAAGNPNFPGVFSGRYDEAVRYNDHSVGLFLNWLKAQGWFDDALIMITSDHGESFGHSFGGHSGPLLYDDLVRVPLLIKLPHQRSGSRIQDLPTEHADLFPTLLDYLDLPIPRHLEGRSLRRALDGGTLESGRVFAMNFEMNGVFSPLRIGSVAIREGPYKYVHYFGYPKDYKAVPKLQDSLYDLRTDPGETINLVSTEPAEAARLRAEIEAQVAAHSLPKEVQ